MRIGAANAATLGAVLGHIVEVLMRRTLLMAARVAREHVFWITAPRW